LKSVLGIDEDACGDSGQEPDDYEGAIAPWRTSTGAVAEAAVKNGIRFD
jgi:hypothetical protein